jgi:hypothetical protein
VWGGAASWPGTDPWPALFDRDAGPQVAGEEEGGARAEARVELALRPWRPRQVTCWGVGRCGILARY